MVKLLHLNMCLICVLHSFNGFDRLRPEYFLPDADAGGAVASVTGGGGAAYQTSYLRIRTKQEIKSSEKMLLGYANMPDLWAK